MASNHCFGSALNAQVLALPDRTDVITAQAVLLELFSRVVEMAPPEDRKEVQTFVLDKVLVEGLAPKVGATVSADKIPERVFKAVSSQHNSCHR